MGLNKKQQSKLVIVFVVAFTLLCVYFIKNLKFDYDFEAFFPNEDKELSTYENFRTTFEHDNEFVLLGIENKAGIFRQDFLQKIDSLSNDLKTITHVKTIASPTQLKTIVITDFGPSERTILHFNEPELYKEDSLNIYSSEDLVGSIFPKNAKSLCIYIKTADNLSKVKSDSLARKIERAFNKYKFDTVHFAGKIIAQEVYLKQLSSEFVIFNQAID